jgi:hypothetical protein
LQVLLKQLLLLLLLGLWVRPKPAIEGVRPKPTIRGDILIHIEEREKREQQQVGLLQRIHDAFLLWIRQRPIVMPEGEAIYYMLQGNPPGLPAAP